MSWPLLIEVLLLPALAVCVIMPQPLDTYPVISSALTNVVNLSATTGNTSLGNILRLRCDPVRYGRNLNVGSCSKASTFLPPDDTQTVFAERGSVQPHDLNLPFRATSSECLRFSGLLHMTVLEWSIETHILKC